MLEYHLDVAALAATSFSCSPLVETVMSLRPRRSPRVFPEHRPYLMKTAAAFSQLDGDLLLALVTRRRSIPDYLTPRPLSPAPSFEEGLAALRSAPAQTVAEHIRQAYAAEPMPAVLADGIADPVALAARILDAVEAYWHSCVQPYWPEMAGVLENEIGYRARQLTAGGARELFTDLDDRLSWADGVLSLNLIGLSGQVTLRGDGLTLVPSLFARGAICMMTPGPHDFIVYPARGRGTAWTSQPVAAADAALAGLLGPTRARLLELLEAPVSTTELARVLQVTPSAVSQHLAALRASRLVNRSRDGRSVLYTRSALGTALVTDQTDQP
jgi:DNA-binding transcriptional ArsR family regulator